MASRGGPEGVEQDDQRKRRHEEAERQERCQALAVDLDEPADRRDRHAGQASAFEAPDLFGHPLADVLSAARRPGDSGSDSCYEDAAGGPEVRGWARSVQVTASHGLANRLVHPRT